MWRSAYQPLKSKVICCVNAQDYSRNLSLGAETLPCCLQNNEKPHSLWAWERALSPRRSSFTNTKLQRRRATTSYPTKNKEKSWSASLTAQTRNKYLPDRHWPCLPVVAWKCNDAYCSWKSQLLPNNPIGHFFLFICLSLAVWLCLKKCSENRMLVVLLQIGAKNLTVHY